MNMGQIDILVNNAGVEKHADFWDVTEADYDFVLHINLKGTFFYPGLRQSSAADQADRQDHQRQFRSRGTSLPAFLHLLRKQGGVENARAAISPSNWRRWASTSTILLRARSRRRSIPSCSTARISMKALLGNIPLNRLGKGSDVGGVAAFLGLERCGLYHRHHHLRGWRPALGLLGSTGRK